MMGIMTQAIFEGMGRSTTRPNSGGNIDFASVFAAKPVVCPFTLQELRYFYGATKSSLPFYIFDIPYPMSLTPYYVPFARTRAIQRPSNIGFT